jgi:hypothetical protein
MENRKKSAMKKKKNFDVIESSKYSFVDFSQQRTVVEASPCEIEWDLDSNEHDSISQVTYVYGTCLQLFEIGDL